MFFKSIRTKIIAANILMLIVLFTITYVIVSSNIYNTMKWRILENDSFLLSKLSQNIGYIIDDTRKFAIGVIFDRDIQRLLNTSYENTGTYNIYKRNQEFNSILKSYKLTRYNIFNIAVIDKNGYVNSEMFDSDYFTTRLNDQWYKDYYTLFRGHGDFFSNTVVYSIRQKSENNSFTYKSINYLKSIYNSDDPDRFLGTIVISLDYNSVADVFSKLDSQNSQYWLLDKDGMVVYGDKAGPVNIELAAIVKTGTVNCTDIFEDNESFFLYERSFDNGWRIVQKLPKRLILSQIRPTQVMLINIFLISILLVSLVLTVITLSLTGSIRKLWQGVRKVSDGNFDVLVDIKTHDEIGGLSKAFNQMTENIQILIGRISVENELKRNYQIKALMLQINPHFIYNTLNSAIYLARRNNNAAVIKLLTSFIVILHENVNWGDGFISIKDEISYTGCYSEIQKIRYGNIFTISFEVQDKLLDYKIPKMLLQPLIENSLYHGIIPKGEKGAINIKISEAQEGLLFSVSDNGAGISQIEIEKLFEKKKESAEDKSDGIGLKNVDDRLKLFFGNRYGLEVKSVSGEYTTVSFTIPGSY